MFCYYRLRYKDKNSREAYTKGVTYMIYHIAWIIFIFMLAAFALIDGVRTYIDVRHLGEWYINTLCAMEVVAGVVLLVICGQCCVDFNIWSIL